MPFCLQTPFTPQGDQPQAIQALTQGIQEGKKSQVLLGITGSGKTFTMANVIAQVQKPTLILAHNKTLAAQLYQEFQAFFPHNAVEYFVSYYDYYQPEAYIARTDTYIEKDLAINDQIERLRLSATRSLLERNDVIIVSSVSCIYGLGTPEYYRQMQLHLAVGSPQKREEVLLHLVHMQYERHAYDLSRGSFRCRGEVVDVMPSYEDKTAIRIEFFGDEIEKISLLDPLTGKTIAPISQATIFPGSHHVTPEDVRLRALDTIRAEMQERIAFYETQNRLIELQRIKERTLYDMEMIREIGFCKGIENYSRHFSERSPGDPPPCLLDYFPADFLLFIDESHQTLPQIHAMHNGDRARKESLVDFGFRLPSAFDNRPLRFEEFYRKMSQVIYVSATPGAFEAKEAQGEIIHQVIRPTGLLDPEITIFPATSQVDHALEEIRKETAKNHKVLVTTLTKKLAEDLSRYLQEIGVEAKYLHSDIDTLERVQIINDLRRGIFSVLVGVNLLREGLDIPEVALVLILDADKEGFLRSETALIQTCGRAARNVEGRVIMYADKQTQAIERTVAITKARREKQKEHNALWGITPTSTKKQTLEDLFSPKEQERPTLEPPLRTEDIEKKIQETEKLMKEAAKSLQFEEATKYRDLLRHYQQLQLLEENV